LLQRAREAAGLHIAALAVALKVPVKKLEALEADRLERLPDAVFARALAASVCRVLKIDSTQILQRLPTQARPRPSPSTNSRGPLAGATFLNRPTRLSGTLSKRAVMGGLVLVAAAALLVLLPPLDFFLPTTEQDATDPDSTSLPSLPIMAVEPTPPGLLPAVEEISAKVNLNGTPDAQPLIKSLVPESVATLPATPELQNMASGTAGIVIFRPTSASWVEVSDAKGAVLLRRKLAAGEVAGASGALPLRVVVGRADVTQVQIRGQAFDLASVSRDNVARFEVN
jgi:cytoskeleton protein RodZ